MEQGLEKKSKIPWLWIFFILVIIPVIYGILMINKVSIFTEYVLGMQAGILVGMIMMFAYAIVMLFIGYFYDTGTDGSS
jgi:hypothetical protein